MIILGVDPGYRNLGLSIVRFLNDEKEITVLESRNMSVGNASAPMTFAKFLWPELNALHEKYDIDGIASETPPFIMGQIKTTAFLWAVSSIIVSWSYQNEIPFRHAAPMSLKRATCTILDMPWHRKYIPKKSDVKKAIIKLNGEGLTTSHENDATLAAALMYGKVIPNKR